VPAAPVAAARGSLSAILLAVGLCLISSPSRAVGSQEADLRCLALTIYHEARGEPDAGKLAVAHVVLNRAKGTQFPRRICDVVYQHLAPAPRACEFSWTCDLVDDEPRELQAWRSSVHVARSAYYGLAMDPTGGASWYHADYVAPKWATALGSPLRIGRHLFYRQAPHGAGSGNDLAAGAETLRGTGWRQAVVKETFAPLSQTPLPRNARAFLRQLKVEILVFAPDPQDRAVRINNAMRRERDELMPGLFLASISPTAVTLQYGNRWFRISP
jgi:hypothetical protein